MIRIGWFSPVSTQTGIAQYSRNVLEEFRRLVPKDRADVVVFHPDTTDTVVKMPYPTIELSDSLIDSDFSALFDVAIYHLGNNEKNHGPIYAAMRRHPGVVVLHDYVYQHYLASVSIRGGFVGASFGALIHEAGGMPAFDFLVDSGVLKSDDGHVVFVPWDGQWGGQVPLGDKLARLGSAAIVHSGFARKGLGADFGGPALQLFMPRPDEPKTLRPIAPEGRPIHVVCGGHIGNTKGLRLLTAAFAADPALKENFRVTIAGFGSDRDFLGLLQADIREIGLGGVFDLVVDPDKETFAAVMATADVFYNLRYPNTEGASLSLVEQMAHHRAVIAYRTGCFAEVPEDACFFLDKIGNVAELAGVLGQIATDRGALRTRGEKAWEVVRDQTAGKYAEGLMEFLEAHIERLQARAALLQSRAQMQLPQPEPQDEAWLRDYVAEKILLDEFYSHHLFVPDGFAACSPEEKSRFLTRNLLHARVSAKNDTAIAKVLERKSSLALYDLVGRLLRFSEEIVFNRTFLPDGLEDVTQRDQDLDFWRIVLRLPPKMSIPMARAALGIPFDAVGQLIEQAERHNVSTALLDYLQLHDAEFATRSGIGPLMTLLGEMEGEPLPPVAKRTNLINLLRAPTPHAGLRLVGFHPVESIGIWTATMDAVLHLCIDGDDPATEIMIGSSLLVNGASVEIIVKEKQSGRIETMSVTFDSGQDTNIQESRFPLPKFAGQLSITISINLLQSPESLDISADTRALGVLIHSLELI